MTTSRFPRVRFRSPDGLYFCAVGDRTVLFYRPQDGEHEEYWEKRKVGTQELDFVEGVLKDLAAGKAL